MLVMQHRDRIPVAIPITRSEKSRLCSQGLRAKGHSNPLGKPSGGSPSRARAPRASGGRKSPPVETWSELALALFIPPSTNAQGHAHAHTHIRKRGDTLALESFPVCSRRCWERLLRSGLPGAYPSFPLASSCG